MRPERSNPERSNPERSNPERSHVAVEPAVVLSTARGAPGEAQQSRSSYGAIPGAELPTFVYVSVLAAFAWIMGASWLAFARGMDADLALGVAVVLAIVFFALPVIIRHVAVAN